MARIYVASLSDYNAGNLHGTWIDLDGKDAEAVQEEIAAMLAESKNQPAEDYAIHDAEGFYGYTVGEHASIADLVTLAVLMDERGEWVASLAGHGVCDLDGLADYIDENYRGEHGSIEDYAAELTEECGWLREVPEHLRNYIDFAAMGRDMELGGEVFTIEAGGGKVHVFTNS